MKITWNDYEVYKDGSQSSNCYGTVELGGKIYEEEIRITDHACPQGRKSDVEVGRHVYYAYDIYMGKLGENFYVDETPDGEWYNEYPGNPAHSINEVKRMVENAIIEYFTFDYKKSFAKEMCMLERDRSLMEEVQEYKNKRDKVIHTKNQTPMNRLKQLKRDICGLESGSTNLHDKDNNELIVCECISIDDVIDLIDELIAESENYDD